MVETLEEFLARRPQRLCKMCGRCCRVATSPCSYDELQRRANEGDKEAIDFLEIFAPYESVEKALEADEELVKNIPDYENRTFYYCRYLNGNLCGKYLDRPKVCHRFPGSPWAIVPPGCGFEGWLFVEREKIMKYIRSLKEEQIEYKALLKISTDEGQSAKLKKLIEMIDENIQLYAQYGSEKW